MYISSAEIITIWKWQYLHHMTRTVLGEAQLSAHYTGIRSIPLAVTYGAPAIAHTHLHTSFIRVVPSNQPDCPLSTTYSVDA